jgi:hypothetical protein
MCDQRKMMDPPARGQSFGGAAAAASRGGAAWRRSIYAPRMPTGEPLRPAAQPHIIEARTGGGNHVSQDEGLAPE